MMYFIIFNIQCYEIYNPSYKEIYLGIKLNKLIQEGNKDKESKEKPID